MKGEQKLNMPLSCFKYFEDIVTSSKIMLMNYKKNIVKMFCKGVDRNWWYNIECSFSYT